MGAQPITVSMLMFATKPHKRTMRNVWLMIPVQAGAPTGMIYP